MNIIKSKVLGITAIKLTINELKAITRGDIASDEEGLYSISRVPYSIEIKPTLHKLIED